MTFSALTVCANSMTFNENLSFFWESGILAYTKQRVSKWPEPNKNFGHWVSKGFSGTNVAFSLLGKVDSEWSDMGGREHKEDYTQVLPTLPLSFPSQDADVCSYYIAVRNLSCWVQLYTEYIQYSYILSCDTTIYWVQLYTEFYESEWISEYGGGLETPST